MFFIVLQAAQAHINHFPMHNSHPVFILSRSSYQKREKRLQFGSDRNSQSKLKRGIKKKKKRKSIHIKADRKRMYSSKHTAIILVLVTSPDQVLLCRNNCSLPLLLPKKVEGNKEQFCVHFLQVPGLQLPIGQASCNGGL